MAGPELRERWRCNFELRLAAFVAPPLAIAALLVAGPGEAAVRACGEPVSSGPQVARTEPEARQLALASWTARAASSLPPGSGVPVWRLAINKSLGCTRAAGGQFTCQAKARACVVKQIAPDGTPPPRLPSPPKPGKGKPTLEV